MAVFPFPTLQSRELAQLVCGFGCLETRLIPKYFCRIELLLDEFPFGGNAVAATAAVAAATVDGERGRPDDEGSENWEDLDDKRHEENGNPSSKMAPSMGGMIKTSLGERERESFVRWFVYVCMYERKDAKKSRK